MCSCRLPKPTPSTCKRHTRLPSLSTYPPTLTEMVTCCRGDWYRAEGVGRPPPEAGALTLLYNSLLVMAAAWELLGSEPAGGRAAAWAAEAVGAVGVRAAAAGWEVQGVAGRHMPRGRTCGTPSGPWGRAGPALAVAAGSAAGAAVVAAASRDACGRPGNRGDVDAWPLPAAITATRSS